MAMRNLKKLKNQRRFRRNSVLFKELPLRNLKKLKHQRSFFLRNPVLVKESGQDGLAAMRNPKKLNRQRRLRRNPVLFKGVPMRNPKKLIHQWSFRSNLVLVKGLPMRNLKKQCNPILVKELPMAMRNLKKPNHQRRIRSNPVLFKGLPNLNGIQSKARPKNHSI